MLLEEVHSHLTAELPTLGATYAIASMPPTPDRVLSLTESPGVGPLRVMSADVPVYDHVRLQVRARDRRYRDSRALAYTAYRLLEGVVDLVIGGGHYYRISAVQAPFPTGRDEQDRALFSVNFDVWRADA